MTRTTTITNKTMTVIIATRIITTVTMNVRMITMTMVVLIRFSAFNDNNLAITKEQLP